MKKQLFVFTALLLTTIINVEAGDSLKVFRRTGIYTMIGGGEYIRLNLNAEHFFLNTKGFHLGAHGGYGAWTAWGKSGSEGQLTLSGLVGGKYHFIELQAGSLMLITTSGKSKEAGPNKTSHDFDLLMNVGYNLRVKHFQLKMNGEYAPTLRLITFNAGVGVIF